MWRVTVCVIMYMCVCLCKCVCMCVCTCVRVCMCGRVALSAFLSVNICVHEFCESLSFPLFVWLCAYIFVIDCSRGSVCARLC